MRTLRLFADEVRIGSFRMARIWNTPLRLALDPTRDSPSRVPMIKVLIVVDGVLRIRQPASEDDLGKGASIVLPEKTPFTLESLSPTARIELSMPLPEMGASGALPGAGTVLVESEYSRILTALVSSILASTLTPDSDGFSPLSHAVEDAALALLRHDAAHRRAHGASSAEARLFSAALRIIDTEARDPDFSVAALAKRLNISDSRVRQIFLAHHSTAQAEIRVARVARATRILSSLRPTTAQDLEAIARSAGFRTARTMSASIDATTTRARGEGRR